MANQAVTDKKDRNGGGDVTKSDVVDTPIIQRMSPNALASTGPSRFIEKDENELDD